ncbi:MAG: peptidoglycan DD-metalloendopeptidase family protein [Nocardioides sp.]|uniref:peptidoglycan DD-metalloendopeptidase family protein n=1 Tax=Nocardioides sp. TaxID=35761 RepID=UPI0039E35232
MRTAAALAPGIAVLLSISTLTSASAGEGKQRYPEDRVSKGTVAKAPTTAYEMPFPCGQAWTGTTRSDHSPSPLSIDWNRTDDYGDDVVAAASGTVTVADTVVDSGYGKWVMLDHGNNETTIYAHLSGVAVKAGQKVDQGTLLGYVGDTGNATGPHLHFEERIGSSDTAPYFHGKAFVFGSTLTSQNCPDVPLAANMRGPKAAEPVYFTRATPAKFTTVLPKKTKTTVFGTASEDPVLGDWDGNGHANVGVRDPATKTFELKTPAGVTTIKFGMKGDLPVAGDWDGDGTDEVGVRRPKGVFRLRHADGSVTRARLGEKGDLPVAGDWDGDGRTDIGVYDQAAAMFTLRIVDEDGLPWTASVKFGAPGDLPVVADWDGNGKTDLGVWDPHTATLSKRMAKRPTATKATVTTIQLGHPR